MPNNTNKNRFGNIAIEKGYITKDQFIEGMALQLENELEGDTSTRIGSILVKMGFMTEEHINKVVASIPEAVSIKCSACGASINYCPDCGKWLRGN